MGSEMCIRDSRSSNTDHNVDSKLLQYSYHESKPFVARTPPGPAWDLTILLQTPYPDLGRGPPGQGKDTKRRYRKGGREGEGGKVKERSGKGQSA